MKRLFYILVALLLFAAVGAYVGYSYATRQYDNAPKRVNVGKSFTEADLHSLLCDSLGDDFGNRVYNIWNLRGGSLSRAHGSYLVKPGETAFNMAMRLRGGMQDAVNVTIPNLRSYERVLEVISDNFEFDSDAFKCAFDSLLAVNDIPQECASAIILPDTYQYYWTAGAETVAASLFKHWNAFWTDDRKSKASSLKLSPLEVSTLASIVEEESAKRDERPVIARLYLNRLDRGMKLQADPTVKYAVGDPALRRILNVHLSTPSPYNTYIVDGLPPGPIRMVDKATVDAVLNAPHNNYLYMCAKEDFSGYHNFASSLSEHNANARRYHAALNRNNIK